MTTPEIWTIQRTAIHAAEYISFRDEEGRLCNLQPAIDRERIFLGPFGSEMEVSREQVVPLIYNLSNWMKYGTLSPVEEEEPNKAVESASAE